MDAHESQRDGEHRPKQAGPKPGRAAAEPLPRAVSEALADPIVRALMAADRVDEEALEQLLRRAAARLAVGVAPPDHDLGDAAIVRLERISLYRKRP
jgi:hypothetical protein